MSGIAIEWLGWMATAVFVGSYFCIRPSVLRAVQMSGALLWVTYGALIGSSPVVVANVLVFSAAAWTLFRRGSAKSSGRIGTAARSGGR
jgi:hypothetical protein